MGGKQAEAYGDADFTSKCGYLGRRFELELGGGDLKDETAKPPTMDVVDDL